MKIENCSFNIIYSLESTVQTAGCSVKEHRLNLCKIIAGQINSADLHYDFVSPIPNTGLLYSHDIAELIGVNHATVFTKNNTKRTLGLSHSARFRLNTKNFDMREKSIEGKNILFVDEALISGQTAKIISQLAFSYGARKIGFSFVSPQITRRCSRELNHRDVLFQDSFTESIESYMEDLEVYLQTKDIFFISEKEFKEALPSKEICRECFGWNDE